jgi:hypothetical protein
LVGVGGDVGFFVGVGVGFFVGAGVGCRVVVVVFVWLVVPEVWSVDVVVGVMVVWADVSVEEVSPEVDVDELPVVSDGVPVVVAAGETAVPEVSVVEVDSKVFVLSEEEADVVPVVPVIGMKSQADIKASKTTRMARRKTMLAERPARL